MFKTLNFTARGQFLRGLDAPLLEGQRAAIVALRAITVLYMILVVVSSLAAQAGFYDEAIPLLQGRMVAQGLRPHVDFWSFYPPLNYYLNAGIYLILGRTILGQRLLEAGFYVLTIAAGHRFLRSRFPGARIGVECTTILLAVVIGPRLLLPSFLGFSFSLLAVLAYFSSRGAAGASWPKAAVAGALTGLALLSRVNFGAYAAAAIMADLALLRLLKRQNDRSEQVGARRYWLTWVAFLSSVLICWIGIYLLVTGAHLAGAIQQSIIFPQHEVMGLRFVPLDLTPGLALAVVFPCIWFSVRMFAGTNTITRKALVPLLLGAIVLAIVWLQGWKAPVARNVVLTELIFVVLLDVFVRRLQRVEMALIVFFVCNLHYYLSRADALHWIFLPVIAVLLVPYLFIAPPEEGVTSEGRLTVSALLAVLIFCFFGLPPRQFSYGLQLLQRGGVFRRMSDSQRVLGTSVTPPAWARIYSDEAELNALRYVRNHTSSKDAVFIGVENHSEAYANDVRAYWLLDRPLGCNYYIFDTDLTIQPAIQQAMIAGLEKNDVRWVILEHHPLQDQAFLERKHPGSKLLDQFLASNYRETARFGRFEVLTKLQAKAQ